MRLVDLVGRVSGVRTVIDTSTGTLDLRPYLHLPDDVDLIRDHGDGDIGPGALALVVLGPDRRLHGEETDLRRALRRLQPGAHALIALGYPSAELPYHRMLDDLVAARSQVLAAASLDYTHLPVGLLAAPTESTDPRLANGYLLADCVARGLRARLLDLEEAAARGRDAESAIVAAQHAEHQLARVVRERDAASQTLQRTRDRVGVLEARVAMLEESTSLKVGRALVAAARRPGRGTARLPHALYGLWRGRGPTTASRTAPVQHAAPVNKSAPVHNPAPVQNPRRPNPTIAEDARHLAYRSLAVGPPRLALAGILCPGTVDALRVDAVVNLLLPHDGRLLVEHSHPDAVVVQVSACADGGPWALTGTGAAPDLDRRLNDIVRAAHSAGRRALLWRDVSISRAPCLAQFDWDAVLDLDAGTVLAEAAYAGANRATLRRIFTHDATRVRLSAIARAAEATDPIDQRRVSVLADPTIARDATRLVEQVLRQEHRPVEIVVPRADHGLDELVASGVAIAVGTMPTAPWISDWTDLGGDRPPTYLLDLVCAQECTDADAVGFVDADGTDDGLGDFVFVPSLNPGLVRRSLHYSDVPAPAWSRRGYRLLGIRGDAAP